MRSDDDADTRVYITGTGPDFIRPRTIKSAAFLKDICVMFSASTTATISNEGGYCCVQEKVFLASNAADRLVLLLDDIFVHTGGFEITCRSATTCISFPLDFNNLGVAIYSY